MDLVASASRDKEILAWFRFIKGKLDLYQIEKHVEKAFTSHIIIFLSMRNARSTSL